VYQTFIQMHWKLF